MGSDANPNPPVDATRAGGEGSAPQCGRGRNVLFLYGAITTYTNTIYEYVDAFHRYSGLRTFFGNLDQETHFDVDLSLFDAVAIHYSVRLPFDQISESAAEALSRYQGLKYLFIQDEYDHTRRAWYWIRRLGIQLVFTVVPQAGVATVYPPQEFPGVRFVSVLTGYVSEHMDTGGNFAPPSTRELVVGYRGRPLPVRYGQLGFDKVEVGRMVQAYCQARGIACDIAWTEEQRIYGPAWYDFMASCRSMLGCESGSNVFDWDGKLEHELAQLRSQGARVDERRAYEQVVRPLEIPGLMNQVSPRVFEAIAAGTVLVLFEGHYSGVVEPWRHYIPLAKDGSNLDEVFAKLADDAFVDAMARRAYDDVIASGRFGYRRFVAQVDSEVEASLRALPAQAQPAERSPGRGATLPLSTAPLRSQPPMIYQAFMRLPRSWGAALRGAHRRAYPVWCGLPLPVRRVLKPPLQLAVKLLKRL